MKLLYISLFSFVFIATSALALNRDDDKVVIYSVQKNNESSTNAKKLPPLPELHSDSVIPVLSAQAVYAIDVDSGVVLYEKNPDEKFLPASTTKIITSLVALENYSLEEKLKVDRSGVSIPGQKMRLIEGEEISVKDLLYGLLVFSANDAAEVLGSNFPGGRAVFVEKMNQKAKELKMDNTNFVNPSGLDGNGQLTTARDLVYAALYSMKNPIFKEMVGTENKVVASSDGIIVHRLKNINALLGKVEGVKGIKTGWTENARENLVTYVERDGKRVVIALLGSQDRFGETKELIEWIYGNYKWFELTENDLSDYSSIGVSP